MTTMLRVALLLAMTVPAARAIGQTTASPSGVQAAFVAIVVPDLDAAVGWYADKLGLALQSRPEGPASRHANLSGPGFLVELIQLNAPPPGAGKGEGFGVTKVGVVVDRPLYTRILARLRETKATFVGREIEDADGLRFFLVEDNSGVRLQFFTR